MSDTLTLGFKHPFDLESYNLFLKAKTLPEFRLGYDWEADSYSIETHKRFARALGLETAERDVADMTLAAYLFDYQKFITGRALEAKRYAIYADCGLGKTAMFLEFARQVMHRTGGKVLIFSPLQIIPQTVQMSVDFYGPDMPVHVIRTREELTAWLIADGAGLAITNYEKMIDGELPELNHLAGLICDESSIFKTGGGVIKWNILHSINGRSGMAPTGVEYRLSCTATPAPNDIMEYASQASFLGKLRNEGDILWTYFSRDKFGNWFIKPYAQKGFYRFLAAWSVYIRNPKIYGFADNLKDIPEPEWHVTEIAPTEEQLDLAHEIRKAGCKDEMIGDLKLGVVKRSKLSQIAKGFMYRKGLDTIRIPSEKPGAVVEIIDKAVRDGHKVLVWTVFDEEGELILNMIREAAGFTGRDINARNLSGKDKENARQGIIEDFRTGNLDVLISKPELLGFGLNFQHCSCMVFSGWDDSYERFYQAVKRAHRYGQTKRLQVHVPYIPELEGMIWENIVRKRGNFEADAVKHEAIYRKILLEEL